MSCSYIKLKVTLIAEEYNWCPLLGRSEKIYSGVKNLAWFENIWLKISNMHKPQSRRRVSNRSNISYPYLI